MTIKVEQESLLRVVERPPIISSIPESSEYLIVNYRKPPIGTGDEAGEKLRASASFDDDDSVFTASTAFFSDTDSEDGSIERRVSFSEDLVTDEWTRPFTPKEELSQLFYTTEETQRFRQEYRMERKLLSELSINPDNFPVDENEELSELISSSCSQPTGRHSISRVVVLHNDKLKTFYTPPTPQSSSTDDFFDNDSFWSGSITWY